MGFFFIIYRIDDWSDIIGKIKRTTVTGITDTNGVLVTDLNTTKYIILCTYTTSSVQRIMEVGFTPTGNYLIRIIAANGQSAAGSNFTVYVYYTEYPW